MTLGTSRRRSKLLLRPMVRLRNVTRTYRQGTGRVRALDRVNMHIPRGVMVGVVGPSGSGKSTLLHVLAGIDSPDTGPAEGSVVFYGKDGRGARLDYSDRRAIAAYRRCRVGIIFQQPNLFSNMSAWQNVAIPLLAQGGQLGEVRDRCRQMLEFVGMGEMWQGKPRKMSSGERQRVAIARALVKGPPLILADEPTGNLDKANTERVLELLEGARNEIGCTVVLVTHDEDLVAEHCRLAYRFVDTGKLYIDRELSMMQRADP